MAPTPEEQIQFLAKLQRLLDEGLFVASYKFALLLALADLSIEAGDDSGHPLPITTEQIAGKFIQYYWRRAVPYVAPAEARVLQQNTGKQAAVVNIVEAARKDHGDSLAAVMNNASVWKPLVREVASDSTQGPDHPALQDSASQSAYPRGSRLHEVPRASLEGPSW